MRRAHEKTARVLAKPADFADKAQVNSELRYRRLFETAQDGILILDADTGEITDVNPFLEKLLSYSHEEFLGKKLWDLGPFKDIEESRADFRELKKKNISAMRICRCKPKMGNALMWNLSAIFIWSGASE